MIDSHASASQSRRGFSAMTLAAALVAGLAIGGTAIWVLRGSATSTEPAAIRTDANALPGVVELPEAAQKNTGVEVITVARTMLPAAIDVTGAVAADQAKVAAIRPLAKGVVQSVSVRLGDRVSAGQTLATLDNVELGTLVGQYLTEQAALRQTQADLDVKQRALERAQELIKLEGIAQQQLDMRQAEFKSADAAVASQRARVSQVEEQIHRFGITDVQLARLADPGVSHRTESLSVLRAPFSGIVTKYDIAPGELVDPEREIFTIADISTVWVMADVYEKDIAKIRRDTDVTVHVDAFPDRVLSGRLTYISDAIDPQTRTAKVRCVVPNPDNALKVDMFARITIPTSDAREALTVPARAIQHIDGAPVVFVRQTATRFERRAVQIGATARDTVEVVGGIKPGEQIVGSGSFYLKTASLRERIAED